MATEQNNIVPFPNSGPSLPAVIEAIGVHLDRPRLMPIEGDGMAPTLKSGDLVAVVPTDRFRCDGIYVLDIEGEPAVYRCASDFRGNVACCYDNPRYTDWLMPGAAFEAKVLGYVVATVNVIDRPAFRGTRS